MRATSDPIRLFVAAAMVADADAVLADDEADVDEAAVDEVNG